MKVLNIHKRIVNQPKNKVTEILKTLSLSNDKIWPKENWPEMKFNGGIKVGAKGGHGPIRYKVEIHNPAKVILFRFSKPVGFNGIHKFEINESEKNKTEIKHTIDMHAKGKGLLIWIFVIRPLHNALIEDAFDKLENNFSENKKATKWNTWVKFLQKKLRNKEKIKPNI
ncbi:hypothetical protein MC378_10650 [Polaribacter sp. MSW13]|uniref:SRPBCC family protein n=1 Tax=Polaribacter marinus TaxID=2916838 RepID=A0A9X1VN75_9FLAO|nr:hypothetical protein [Polaribacter marinus]MCI2229624.1 hypothetical protein [Polaribacter marinus]